MFLYVIKFPYVFAANVTKTPIIHLVILLNIWGIEPIYTSGESPPDVDPVSSANFTNRSTSDVRS